MGNACCNRNNADEGIKDLKKDGPMMKQAAPMTEEELRASGVSKDSMNLTPHSVERSQKNYAVPSTYQNTPINNTDIVTHIRKEEEEEKDYYTPILEPSSGHESNDFEPWSVMLLPSPVAKGTMSQLNTLKLGSIDTTNLRGIPAIEGTPTILRNRHTAATYESTVSKGRPHGWGKMVSLEGTVTEGFFVNGQPEVYVREVYGSGGFYEGEFHGGKPNGRGVFQSDKGVMTKCDHWKQGKAQGFTTISSVINSKRVVLYSGMMKDGRKHGRGVFYQPSKNLTQTGTFEASLLEGQGNIDHGNGYKYEGDFIGGEECGKGTVTFVDGRRWEGDFKNGKPHGTGIMYKDDGTKAGPVTFK